MLPKRDSLTIPDDHTHAKLESEVESMSNSLARIDGQLYHFSYDQEQMHQFFVSIARRASACAALVKETPDNAL